MKKIIKSISFAALTLLSLSAFANNSPTLINDASSTDTPTLVGSVPQLVAHGIYLGAGLGYAKVHNKNVDESGTILGAVVSSLDHITARLFLGMRFNDYFGIEMGYARFSDYSESGGINNVDNHSKVHGLDFETKWYYPFECGLGVFLSLGGAYVMQDILDSVRTTPVMIKYQNKSNKFLPLFGGGIMYNFTKSFAMDVNYMHIQGINRVKSIDMGYLGMSYTFPF